MSKSSSDQSKIDFQVVKDQILEECRLALSKVNQRDIDLLIDYMKDAERIFFIGVGRVLLSLSSMAKRLSHLGFECHMVGEITEPALQKNDLLIVASGSGNSVIPVAIAKKAKLLGGKIIHIGSNPESDLREITDLMVRIPVQTKLYLEDEIRSCQPMSSLFEQSLLILGDTIAKMIVEEYQVKLDDLWAVHANLE